MGQNLSIVICDKTLPKKQSPPLAGTAWSFLLRHVEAIALDH